MYIHTCCQKGFFPAEKKRQEARAPWVANHAASVGQLQWQLQCVRDHCQAASVMLISCTSQRSKHSLLVTAARPDQQTIAAAL
jgi:hypothetical protein